MPPPTNPPTTPTILTTPPPSPTPIPCEVWCRPPFKCYGDICVAPPTIPETPSTTPKRAPCNENGKCQPGYKCVDNVCVPDNTITTSEESTTSKICKELSKKFDKFYVQMSVVTLEMPLKIVTGVLGHTDVLEANLVIMCLL